MNFTVQTKGRYDFINLTNNISSIVSKSAVQNGVAVVFIASSTVGLTTIEYEEGVIQDLIEVFEKIAPENANYKHHEKWGDRNGAAHIKSGIIGTNLSIPIENGKLKLGTWQQIVLIDFDERPRTREVTVKAIKS